MPWFGPIEAGMDRERVPGWVWPNRGGDSMKRRTFLKGEAAAGAAVGIGFDISHAGAEMRQLKGARTAEARSIGPHCAGACGIIVHPLGGRAKNDRPTAVHDEGDPDSPTK